eukprot:gene1044-biopygen277
MLSYNSQLTKSILNRNKSKDNECSSNSTLNNNTNTTQFSTPSRHSQQTTVSFSTVQQELEKPSCTTHWYTICKLPDTKSNAWHTLEKQQHRSLSAERHTRHFKYQFLCSTVLLATSKNKVSEHNKCETHRHSWDEASMVPATALKAVGSLLRDCTKVHKPFGCKYFMIGSNFRQVLPVLKKAGREGVVQECLKSRKVEDVWSHFQQFTLITNMRAAQDQTYQAFSDWLLRIGNAVEPHNNQDHINLPQQICIKSLICMNSIYPQAESADAYLLLDPKTMSERCCLTPKNEFSHHINELVLQRLTARQQYLSIDRVETDDPEEAAAYPREFLNAHTSGGIPLHSLQLNVYTLYLNS